MRLRSSLLAGLAVSALLGGTALAATQRPHAPAPALAASPGADDTVEVALSTADPGEVLGVLVHGTDIEAAIDAVETAGLEPALRMDRIDVVWAYGTPAQIDEVRTLDGVTHLELDAPLASHGDTSHTATRGHELADEGFAVTDDGTACEGPGKADPRGNAFGIDKQIERCEATSGGSTTQIGPFDGAGVTVAIIDSGVDGTHPMFTDGGNAPSRVVVNKKFLPPCVVGLNSEAVDDQAGQPVTEPLPCFGPASEGFADPDRVLIDVPTNDSDTISAGGHGTHVATIAAGGEFVTEDGRTIRGAAPAAQVVALSAGQSLTVGSATAAQYWVLEHYLDPCGDGSCPPIRVVNNSYGPTEPQTYNPNDATSKIQDELARIDFDGDLSVAMVWAAGNDGGDGSTHTTNDAGSSPTQGVIMVANYDDNDTGTRDGSLAGSSSRGNRNDRATWPDISAPGTDITAGCRPYLSICYSGEGDAGTISGTSMAAPHVAGIVAQLFQADPSATAGEIELAIENTAHQYDFGGQYIRDLAARNGGHASSFDKGHGLIDAVEAAKLLLGFRETDGIIVDAACTNRADIIEDGRDDASSTQTDLVGVSFREFAYPGDGGPDYGFEVTIEVDDLTEGYPDFEAANANNQPVVVPTQGYGIRFGFSLGEGDDARPYTVSASRAMYSPDGLDDEDFSLEWQNENVTSGLAALEGSFDFEADTVTIILTNDAIREANLDEQRNALGEPQIPLLGLDTRLTNLLARTNVRLDAVVVASIPEEDTAATGCDWIIGSGLTDPLPPSDDEGDGSGGDGPSGDFTEVTVGPGDTVTEEGAAPTTNTDYTCEGPGDERCVTYLVHVEVDGELTAGVEADFPLDDFDIALYDAAGNELASAGAPLTPPGTEYITEAVTAGDYLVVVQPYLAEADVSTFEAIFSLS